MSVAGMDGRGGARVRRPGQPLLAMVLVLGCWVAMRAVTWQPLEEPGATAVALSDAGMPRPLPPLPPAMGGPLPRSSNRGGRVFGPTWPAAPAMAPESPVRPGPVELAPAPGGQAVAAGDADANVVTVDAPPRLRRVAHALLWMAAVSDLPLPAGMPFSTPLPVRGPATGRWSADGWLLVRPDGAGSARAAGLPVYGASQTGAVLRYRLGSGGIRPQAYLRATAALDSGERGLAAGLSVRPLAAVPVRVMAEARVDRFAGGGGHARAAVLAVSEVPPVALPGGLRSEGYVQGGYVAGAAGTGFVDGQFRLDRLVAGAPQRGELRAGAGLWGGAQRGSARLDVGPSATIGLAQGPVAARLAFDWRFRVAGNAAPASGPSLTISAGF
ncbi:MAG: hypothetical protein KGN34_12245 [Sphingomonadales bacterium]|nr:hypothetical protein [Sphingomonadales bacterium]